jgi:hypothetical protein
VSLNVTLSCALTRRPDAVELAYTIINGEPSDIGVFNWLEWQRPDGTLAFPPSSAYVELSGEQLLVRKRALPIPEGLRMAAYVPPPASRIAAGARFDERIVLAIPVQVLQPFRAALMRAQVAGEVVADKPALARALRLEVGVFPLAGVSLTAIHPAHPKVFGVSPPGPAVSGQQVLSFELRLDPPLDVLDYRGEPWP